MHFYCFVNKHIKLGGNRHTSYAHAPFHCIVKAFPFVKGRSKSRIFILIVVTRDIKHIPRRIVIQSTLTLDTIGNCQRLAFTVGVSQHMHKITNM